MTIRHALRIYGQGIRISASSSMAYRADFFVNLIISLLSNLLLPLVTVLIYGAGAAIPGWSFHEALCIQAVFMLCTGVSGACFYSLVGITMGRIREGSYDLLLIKPGPVIVITLSDGFAFDNLGSLLGGTGIFIYALTGLAAPSALQWLQFVFLFLMGLLVLLGMTLIMSATMFKWVGNSRIFEIFDAVSMFGRYPGTIFPRTLATFITYLLPVGMLGFLPASALLGGLSAVSFLACIPCVIFMLLGYALFRHMVTLYQSAGG